MTATGILKLVNETKQISEKYRNREFVITTDITTPYPQHVSFTATQDKCETLDNFKEGDELTVEFNLKGREWNGPQGIKYFNTLEAWKITKN